MLLDRRYCRQPPYAICYGHLVKQTFVYNIAGAGNIPAPASFIVSILLLYIFQLIALFISGFCQSNLEFLHFDILLRTEF